MIYETEDNILRDVQDYSVILHQVNCNGIVQPGIAMSICKQYPYWFSDYTGYCKWFAGGHQNEILGTFHRYQPDACKNVIICSAFAQLSAGKNATQVDMDAWLRILKKIRRQTEYVNTKFGKNWTIHIQDTIGSFSKSLQNEELLDLFAEVFGEAENADVYIHTTK